MGRKGSGKGFKSGKGSRKGSGKGKRDREAPSADVLDMALDDYFNPGSGAKKMAEKGNVKLDDELDSYMKGETKPKAQTKDYMVDDKDFTSKDKKVSAGVLKDDDMKPKDAEEKKEEKTA